MVLVLPTDPRDQDPPSRAPPPAAPRSGRLEWLRPLKGTVSILAVDASFRYEPSWPLPSPIRSYLVLGLGLEFKRILRLKSPLIMASFSFSVQKWFERIRQKIFGSVVVRVSLGR